MFAFLLLFSFLLLGTFWIEKSLFFGCSLFAPSNNVNAVNSPNIGDIIFSLSTWSMDCEIKAQGNFGVVSHLM